MKINKNAIFDLLNRKEKLYFGEHLNSMSKITLEKKLQYSIDSLTQKDYESVSHWEKHLLDAQERIVSMKKNIELRNEQDIETAELLNELYESMKKSCEDTERSLALSKSILQTKIEKVQVFQERVDNMLALDAQIELV